MPSGMIFSGVQAPILCHLMLPAARFLAAGLLANDKIDR